MPRYVLDHIGSSVEVATNFWSQKCRLLVDGRRSYGHATPVRSARCISAWAATAV